MNVRKIFLYVCTTVTLSWLLQFVVLLLFKSPTNPAAVPLMVVTMFTPAAVTCTFGLVDREARRHICWRPTWRMLPFFSLAVLVPTLIAFATVFCVNALHWGYSEWFRFGKSGVVVSGGPWILGRNAQNWPYFVMNVIVTGFCFAALSAVAAMGEEIGWRGLLQGLLVQRLGTTRGIALLGLIWAIWHMPLLLAGYNYPEHPVLGALLLFPVQLISASYFFGWLTLRTGSFWAAAVSHGAVNSIEVGVMSQVAMHAPHLYLDLAQIILTLVVGLISSMLVRRARPSS